MLVRALIWVIVGFLVYTVYQMIRQAILKPPKAHSEKSAHGEDMIQDPVCKTYVPKTDAVKGQINGRKTYYCSIKCRDQHKQNT